MLSTPSRHVAAGFLPMRDIDSLPDSVRLAMSKVRTVVAANPDAIRSAVKAYEGEHREEAGRVQCASVIHRAVSAMNKAVADASAAVAEAREVAARLELKTQQYLAEQITPWRTALAQAKANEWAKMDPTKRFAATQHASEGKPSLDTLLALQLSGHDVTRQVQELADPKLFASVREVEKWHNSIATTLLSVNRCSERMALLADSPVHLQQIPCTSAEVFLQVAFDDGIDRPGSGGPMPAAAPEDLAKLHAIHEAHTAERLRLAEIQKAMFETKPAAEPAPSAAQPAEVA